MIDKCPDYPRREKSPLNPEEVIQVENGISNITCVLGSGLDMATDTVKCMC